MLETDILIATATPTETRAVLHVFAAIDGDLTHVDGRLYYDLGVVRGSRVRLTQCEAGSGGVGASLQAITKAIHSLHPHAVIMVGIAFGIDAEKQSIGDVLVAIQLRLYEYQRVGTDLNGAPLIVPRGDRPHVSSNLLGLFRAAEIKSELKLRFGTMLSGEKLVDNFDFRAQLRALEPEAIGGEMEASGVYVACNDNKVDWIIVKAICDFADGDKHVDKDARQALAAKNAATVLRQALGLVDLNRTRSSTVPTLTVSGGRGGHAKVGSGVAVAGPGGGGGPPGALAGGAGGDAIVEGHGIAIGGEGGEAGQSDRGGRGGRAGGGLLDDLLGMMVRPEPGRGGDGGFVPVANGLTGDDMRVIEAVLEMQSGYVSDFVDRTFSAFFRDQLGIDIDGPEYRIDGSSKAKRLRTLLKATQPPKLGEILVALLEHHLLHCKLQPTDKILIAYREIVARCS